MTGTLDLRSFDGRLGTDGRRVVIWGVGESEIGLIDWVARSERLLIAAGEINPAKSPRRVQHADDAATIDLGDDWSGLFSGDSAIPYAIARGPRASELLLIVK